MNQEPVICYELRAPKGARPDFFENVAKAALENVGRCVRWSKQLADEVWTTLDALFLRARTAKSGGVTVLRFLDSPFGPASKHLAWAILADAAVSAGGSWALKDFKQPSGRRGLQWQPAPEVYPEDLPSFAVFTSREAGMAHYPDIPTDKWVSHRPGDIERPTVIA